MYERGLLREARFAEMGLPLTPDQLTNNEGASLEKEYDKGEKRFRNRKRSTDRVPSGESPDSSADCRGSGNGRVSSSLGGVRNLSGKRTVVRNGDNPERMIQTGIGELSVRMPKVRDRSQNGVVFHSSLIPLYIRKTRSLEELIPLLYLKDVSTGQMEEARGLSWDGRPGDFPRLWSPD